MTAADWWRKIWFQVESVFVCFGLMWCPYFLHSYGGSLGLFCLFPIPYFEKKSKINSLISVLFSFFWITLDFFCFFSSDIDSLLWTKHSSILSPEVSSVEEIEPVEGMPNNLRLLIEQLSSSCLLFYLLKQMIVIRTEKPPKRRSTMAPKECTFLSARQIINTNECSATNQPVGMLLFSWFNFIIMSHTWSCLIVSSILSTFIFTSFLFLSLAGYYFHRLLLVCQRRNGQAHSWNISAE